ncbi:hypothetical protein ACFLRY_01085 [Bacteroidota bacterium]
MKNKNRNILALLIIILPFFFIAIGQKLLLKQNDYLVQEFLGYYMLLAIFGISTIIATNKYLLKNKLSVFASKNGKAIIDIALSFLILAIMYLILSLADISYNRWIEVQIDRTAIESLLKEVFSNKLYALIFIGPFNWLNEGFLVLSLAFILNNLWQLSKQKLWIYLSIFLTSVMYAMLNINQGIPSMITFLIILLISSFVYYKYRRIYPLLIARILFQTISFITYWVYN